MTRPARLLCLLAIAYARSAYAQAPSPPTVVEIRLEQEGQTVTDPVLTGLIETRPGRPLSMADVRETQTHLHSLNRFFDVQVFREDVPGGVRIRYVLVPLHPIDRLEFRGNLLVSEGDLRRVVNERLGSAPSAGRADEAVDALREAYARKGFRSPAISSRVEETHNPDRATLVFEIQPGPRALISEVRAEQIDAREQSTILGLPDVRRGQPYDAEEIDRELQRWADGMRANGYYEAQARHFATPTPDGVFVTVNLSRGPRVVIAFAGDSLPEDERERLVPVRAEGSADEDLLEDSRRDIEEYLRGRGYRDASAEYARTEKDGELTITFNIDRGPRYVVDEVVLAGNAVLTPAELRELVTVKEGDVFIEAAFDASVNAIRAIYAARGFTQAKIQPSTRVVPPTSGGDDDRRVAAGVTIVEGPRTLVKAVEFSGNTVLNDAALQTLLSTAAGRPFAPVDVAADRDAIDLEYRNRGYESVSVEPAVTLDEGNTQAIVSFAVSEGPQILIDRIIIVGNARTKTETIERELLLSPGGPLGYTARVESQQRLAALGLFRRVSVAEIPHGSEPRRDILIRVEEAPPTTVGYGGGLEVGMRLRPTGEGGTAEERLDAVPRAFFEIGRRNLGGRNRAVNLFTRVSLRTRDTLDTSSYGFNEYRVFATYREPRVFNSRTDVLVTGILDQAIRSSFNFIRRELRTEAGLRLAPPYSVLGRYSLERTELFDEKFAPDEQPLIDRLFSQVRLSRFSGSLLRDTRDDPLDPARGTFIVVDGNLAARAIGSEVGFVKTLVQVFSYNRLPSSRRIVLATGARLGAAHGFAREKEGVIVQDLPASERFFAGGDTTVRGFSLDRLGNEETITPAGFPTGGNGQVILNAELRVSLFGAIESAMFVDAGNIFPRASDISLTDLRPAAGFGVRYRSRLLPVRIDLGFNLDRKELVPGRLERGSVLHISLGQAF
jgi:outer membrane protein insertion porin family